MAANPKYRFLYVAWAFVETLLFGGLIYGWGSLVFILKGRSVYDFCDQNNYTIINTSLLVDVNTHSSVSYVTLAAGNSSLPTFETPGDTSQLSTECKEQDSMLNLVFTVASSLFCAGCAAMGHISFKFGTRVTRVVSMLVFVIGALCIAFVSPELPWLIFPGLTCIGIGGIPLLVTNAQLSNLFITGSSTIVGLLCGAFDTSSGVQLVIKLAYEEGFSLQNSYFILVGLHSMVIVSTFFFLPKGFIPKPDIPKVEQEVAFNTDDDMPSVVLLDNEVSITNRQKELVLKVPEETKLPLTSTPKLPSLTSCICSSSYLLHVLWLSILQLRFYYYLSTLNPILNKVLNNDEVQVSHYTNISMYMMMAGLVTSPFAGIVYDFMKRFFVNSRSELRSELMPSVLPLTVGTVLGLLVTVFCLISDVRMLYVIFLTVTFFRSFLYCMGAAFVSAVFPSEYFGLLYGLMIICGGVVSFLQYGLFRWAEVSDYSQVNYFFLPLVAITLVHPAYVWIRCRRAESLSITDQEE